MNTMLKSVINAKTIAFCVQFKRSVYEGAAPCGRSPRLPARSADELGRRQIGAELFGLSPYCVLWADVRGSEL